MGEQKAQISLQLPTLSLIILIQQALLAITAALLLLALRQQVGKLPLMVLLMLILLRVLAQLKLRVAYQLLKKYMLIQYTAPYGTTMQNTENPLLALPALVL